MSKVTGNRSGNARRIAVSCAAFMAGVILLVALAAHADLKITELAETVASTDPVILIGVILLTCLNLLISAEKWRIATTAMGFAAQQRLGRSFGFFYTALGAVLGQLLLPQLATALTRALGSRLQAGTPVAGGIASTAFEQFFDLLVAFLLFVATALVIGGVFTIEQWPVLVVILLTPVLVLLVGVPNQFFVVIARHLARIRTPWGKRAGDLLSHLIVSGAFTPKLMATLFGLSGLRFVVLSGRAVLVAWSVDLSLSWWAAPVSLPTAQLSAALALIPGSFGITEWSWSSVIVLLGEPVAVASTFVLLHRMQGIVGLLIAVAMGALLEGSRLVVGRRRRLSIP